MRTTHKTFLPFIFSLSHFYLKFPYRCSFEITFFLIKRLEEKFGNILLSNSNPLSFVAAKMQRKLKRKDTQRLNFEPEVRNSTVVFTNANPGKFNPDSYSGFY